ncbi:MAG: hypothetical protein Q9191_007569 [Dirinaria sp. TL-2023a]
MDPVSIFAIVEGAGGLAIKCISLAKTLSDISGKFREARLTILSMVQNLEIVQLAWERIDKWSQKYLRDGIEALCEEDEKLFKRLETSLHVGNLVMEALEEDLLPFQRKLDRLGLRGKASIVWSESTLNAHQDRLGHQVQAMTCLLQTIQLELPETRGSLLEFSKPILFKSDESAYTIAPSRTSSKLSLCTTSTGHASLQYHPLAFEDELFTARVYKRNYRNGLFHQLFKTRSDRGRKEVALELGRGVISHTGTPSNPRHPQESVINHHSWSIDLMFMKACQMNAADTVRELILSDFQNISFDLFRYSLAEAVLNDRFNVAQTILRTSSESVGNDLMEEQGPFLIERAWVKPDPSFLQLLLDAVAKCSDPVARFNLDRQLLKAASTDKWDKWEMTVIMIKLIKAGADVNCADEHGLRPLHLVSLHTESWAHIQTLLDLDADIDAQDNEGMTPLIYACSHLMLSSAHSLVGHGANLNISARMSEKAIDKLRKPQVSFSLVSNLKRGLEDLRVADIDALNPFIHSHLQESALRRDMRPIRAALWFMRAEFSRSLICFVNKRFEEIQFPSEAIKTSDMEFLIDLILKAYHLSRLSGVLCNGTATKYILKPYVDSITDFIHWIVYKFTVNRYQESQINMLKSACQPLRAKLSDIVPGILYYGEKERIPDLLRDLANTLPEDWTYDRAHNPYEGVLN